MLRRPRTALLSAAATALLLSGCSFTSPYTTQMDYAPSDGVLVKVSDEVRVENLLVLTPDEDATDLLIGFVVNDSRTDPVDVTLADGEGGELWSGTLEPESTVNLNDEPVELDKGATPGSTVPVTVSAEGVDTVAAQAPVLDGTLPEYADYLEEYGRSDADSAPSPTAESAASGEG